MRRTLRRAPKEIAAVVLAAVCAATFSGFARAQSDLCASPQAHCARALPPQCLQRLSAGSLSTDALADGVDCSASFDAYRGCLASVAEQCGGAETQEAPREATARCDAETSRELWRETREANDCLGYRTFLEACPSSPQASLAESWISRLSCDADAAPSSAVDRPDPVPPAPEARRIQQALNDLGYEVGVVGGFGARDRRRRSPLFSATPAFQRRGGLRSTRWMRCSLAQPRRPRRAPRRTRPRRRPSASASNPGTRRSTPQRLTSMRRDMAVVRISTAFARRRGRARRIAAGRRHLSGRGRRRADRRRSRERGRGDRAGRCV